MNNEEKLAILADAEARCYEALKAATPGSEGMRSLLRDLFDISLIHVEEEEESSPTEQSDSPKPAPAPEAKEPVKLDPTEEPKPVETLKEPTLTKADMIVKLTPHQNNGVDIGKVMKDMGYAKLSDVPAARYWELLENVQKAADGEG